MSLCLGLAPRVTLSGTGPMCHHVRDSPGDYIHVTMSGTGWLTISMPLCQRLAPCVTMSETGWVTMSMSLCQRMTKCLYPSHSVWLWDWPRLASVTESIYLRSKGSLRVSRKEVHQMVSPVWECRGGRSIRWSAQTNLSLRTSWPQPTFQLRSRYSTQHNNQLDLHWAHFLL